MKPPERKTARQRLLDAADELFYAHGVHVVGVDRIAERAGVTKATLYRIFGSKENLVRAYLEEHLRRRQESVGAIVATDRAARDRIKDLFIEIEQALGGPDFRGCRFIMATAESPRGDASEEVTEKYRVWLRAVFTELGVQARAKDAKELARALVLLYDGAAVAARLDRDRRGTATATLAAVAALLDATTPPRRVTGRKF